MLIKFIARGTGSAACGGRLPHAGDWTARARSGPTSSVLRGDPDQVAAVADALEFEQKYTSAVIAWAPEDQPSDSGGRPGSRRVRGQRLGRVWRRTATPGRRFGTARQNGGVHVHVVAARCDLETGKSLNIAPPGWEQTYGPLVEACNVEYAWSRPDDPARARVQQPGHRAYIEAAELRAGTKRDGGSP